MHSLLIFADVALRPETPYVSTTSIHIVGESWKPAGVGLFKVLSLPRSARSSGGISSQYLGARCGAHLSAS